VNDTVKVKGGEEGGSYVEGGEGRGGEGVCGLG